MTKAWFVAIFITYTPILLGKPPLDPKTLKQVQEVTNLSPKDVEGFKNQYMPMFKELKFEKTTAQGKTGVQVSGIKDKSILHTLGLRDKDILVGINSKGVDQHSALLQLVSQIKQEKGFQLNVIRDQKPVSVKIVFPGG